MSLRSEEPESPEIALADTRHSKDTVNGATLTADRRPGGGLGRAEWRGAASTDSGDGCRGQDCCARGRTGSDRRGRAACSGDGGDGDDQLPVRERNRQNSDDLRSMSAKSQGDPGEDHVSRCHESWLRP